MKLSDFNLKDPVHSRLCRFIIHRYFGQFLERNLVLDQLSLSLISGSLNIHDVNINVHYVNELLTSLNVPLKLIDGFIGGIAIGLFTLIFFIFLVMIKFMDEQMKNCQQEGKSAETITSQPQGMGSITNLNKFLNIKGVTFYTDVFSQIDDQPLDPNNTSLVVTSMYIRREKQKQVKSPTHSSHDEQRNPELFMSTMSSASANFHSCYSNCGEQKFSKVNLKIEVEIFFKRLNVFITPTQIDIIKRLIIVYLFLGNWNQREDFHEFDSVNLEDNRYSRKFSEQLKEGYKSIKNETGKKESTHLKATFGIVLLYIPHHDLMSSENVQKLEHSNNIIDKLLAESESFFNLSTQFKPLSNTPLYTFRNQLDNLYNKDHLRFIGSSVVWNHQIDKNIDGEHMSAKLIVSNADCIEYLTNASNPVCNSSFVTFLHLKLMFFQLNTQACHIPLLDFSNFENIDQDPHLKLIFTTSSAERGKSKIHIYVGNCQSELDLSLIDRISDLVVPRPFFDNPSFGRGRLDSLTRVDNFQLSDELFNTVSTVEKKEPTLMVINCMDWNLNFRVPKADMRDPSEAKIPYQQRNIHAEYLALRLKSASVEIPIGDEYTSIELLCSEITGDFCGLSPEFECSDDDQRFLYGTQASIDDKVHLKFEYDLRNRSLKASGTRILAPGVDDMTRSISLSVMQSLPQREGPFSQTRLSFSQNHEEDNDVSHYYFIYLIQAGTREEMMTFGNTCLQQSASIIHIDIPILRFYIPNHSSLEVLYNRLVGLPLVYLKKRHILLSLKLCSED
uniref:Autophagy-related protein 2 n=1 Tax=Heterorhabditis bacteriophora TaxID=37862 RepID=A0A1I7WZ88_HETBA